MLAFFVNVWYTMFSGIKKYEGATTNALVYIPPPPEKVSNYQRELPIGALFIGTYAKHAGHNVKMIDGLESNSFSVDDGFVPDVLGISMLTMYSICVVDSIRKFIADVKKVSDPVVVCGGPGSSVLSKALLNDHLADYVVTGPGEDVFVELLSAFETGSAVSGIPGLAYLDDTGSFVETPRTRCTGDCLSLQTDYSLMDVPRYINKSIDDEQAVAICASRGCKFRCTFCYNEAFYGCSFQPRPVSAIVAEMKILNAQYGVTSFRIMDEDFGSDKAHMRELCNAIIAELPPVTWWCMTRSGVQTREDYELMRRSGCRIVSFGVETADPQMSRKIRKGINLARMPAEIKLLHELGFLTSAFFITAFPGETREQLKHTCEFMMASKLDEFWISRFYLIPDTVLFEELESSGRVTMPKTVAEFQAYLSPKHYPNYSEIPERELDVVEAFVNLAFRFEILFQKGKFWSNLKMYVNARVKGSGNGGIRYLFASLALYLKMMWRITVHPLIRKKYGLQFKNFQRFPK